MKFKVGNVKFASRDVAQAEAHCDRVNLDVKDLEVEMPAQSRVYVPVRDMGNPQPSAPTTAVDEEESTD